MTNAILVLALLAVDAPLEPPPQALDDAQRKQLQSDLHALAVGIGVEQPPDGAEVTLAKVSDRALSLLERSVATAAAGVERAAPQVWRVAIRQQYAKAIAPLIAPAGAFVGLLILAIVLYRKARTWLHSSETWEDPSGLVVVISLLALVATPGMILLSTLTDSAMYLINPEWYALRDLVSLLLGKTVQ